MDRRDHPDFFDNHRITVTVASRRGRQKLHTFSSEELTNEEEGWNGPWRWWRISGGPDPQGARLNRSSTVHLAQGVDVAADTLVFVLDALRYDGRHQVDLGDVNRVVSQLGSRIAGLGGLPFGPTRTAAANALNQEILRRCT